MNNNDLSLTFKVDHWVDIVEQEQKWKNEIISNTRKYKIDIILGGKTVEEKTEYIIDKWFKNK